MTLTKEKVLELLSNIKIAKVVSFFKNENSDHLLVVKILTSDGEKQIVTGANNFKEGDLVPYLGVGFVVPGFLFKSDEVTLEARKLRGYDSFGMILAEDEIGLSEDHEGIMVVQGGDDLVGKSITDVLTEDQIANVLKNAGVVEMTPEIKSKVDLITRELQEFVGVEDMPAILAERSLKIYWGTAPTGKPHLAYFVPMMKIADLLQAGCEVTILFANIHAFLDNMKSTWELLEYRTQYYQLIITEILKTVNVPVDKLKFVVGRDYQLKEDYTLDVYKVAALASLRDVQKAGAEVVKQVESPLLSGMLYPILQALDEEYLEADAQLGGEDQRKIFMFAREYLPKIGYKKRIHLMNYLIPGLGKSGKMSSSKPNSKIDLDDSDEIIKDKIQKAYSLDGQIEGNGLLALLRFIIFRKLESETRLTKITRPEKWGGDVEYANYKDLENDFAEGKLSSVDLKPIVAQEIISLISGIRETIKNNADLLNKAYPKNN